MAYHGGYNEPNESIYNIIPAKIIRQEKPTMYRSKHPADKPPTASSFHQNSTTHPHVSNLAGDAYGKVVPDRASRSMGKAPGSNTSTPRDYMRKMEHTHTVSTLVELKLKNPEKLRPTELKPKLKESVCSTTPPIMNLVTTKNFIVANAVQNILAAPTKISQGAKDFLIKEDYGKVPKYLAHVKEDIRAEYDYIERLEQERADMTRSNVHPIGEEERQELITNLKIKWEQVNSGYQGMTHITKLDTVGKTRRKEGYEGELAQIEKDIEKLNRKNILVNGHC